MSIQMLDDFFAHWVHRHKVVATVEGGLQFQEAINAWRDAKRQHAMTMGLLDFINNQLTKEREASKYHKAQAEEWLTAYQRDRVKNIGDYTRMFVHRPRLRRLIRFLMTI